MNQYKPPFTKWEVRFSYIAVGVGILCALGFALDAIGVI